MRVATLLLANAFLLAAMAVAYRSSRRSERGGVRPDPTARRMSRRLLAAALVFSAAHVVLLGVEGV